MTSSETTRLSTSKSSQYPQNDQQGASGGLLFVNETKFAPSFSPGTRSEIRAHVCSIQTAKKSRLSYRHTRKRHYVPIRAAENIPATIPKQLRHDENCPSSLLSYPTRKATYTPHILHGKNVCRGLESSISDHLKVPKLVDPGLSGSGYLEVREPEEATSGVCKTCGQELRPKEAKNDTYESLIKSILLPADSWDNNPVNDLRAGRIDPFSCYPITDPRPLQHKLIDHIVTYLIPGLVPADVPNNSVNSAAKAWFSSSLETPFLFHALVFASSIHLDFLHYSKIFPNSPRALSHKLFVIQTLNEIISDPIQAVRDEVILAILILAAHEIIHTYQPEFNSFHPPLQKLKWLQVYGSTKFIPEHLEAMWNLVDLKGGIENVKMIGLAETLIEANVICATQSLSKPTLPLLRSSGVAVSGLKSWASSLNHLSIRTQGTGFRKLRYLGLTDEMLCSFEAISAMNLAIDHHLQGMSTGFGLGCIARAREAVQHELLCLPCGNNLDRRTVKDPSIYESCRLSALIFSVGVTYPIPNSFGVLRNLVQCLKISITAIKVAPPFDLLLWMLVLGGIAAVDKPEREWYVSELVVLKQAMDIRDWDSIKVVLESFLWLESACGQGGRFLWSERIERNHDNN